MLTSSATIPENVIKSCLTFCCIFYLLRINSMSDLGFYVNGTHFQEMIMDKESEGNFPLRLLESSWFTIKKTINSDNTITIWHYILTEIHIYLT